MTKWLLGLTVAALAAASASAQTEPTAVVKKAIEAHGGADALKKNKAGTYKVKGDMQVFGSELGFTGDITYELPDKFRMALDAELAGQKISVAQIANGKKFKNTVNGQAAKLGDPEKAELQQAAKMQEISQLFPLLDPKYTLKAETDAKVGEDDAAVILVSAEGFKPTKLFFSKKSGLLVKTERKGLAPGMGESKEVIEETVMSDYKKVDGVMIPMKMLVNHDGKKFMAMTVTEAKLMEKADAKAFAIDD